MDASRDQWIARSAAALCAASRWLSGASLVLAGLALCYLYNLPTVRAPVAVALSFAVAAGAGQAYLVLRVEFDRRIFEALAETAAGSADAAHAFNRAMLAPGLTAEGKAGRTVLQRAEGLVSLVRKAGWLFVSQLVLLIVAPWIPA